MTLCVYRITIWRVGARGAMRVLLAHGRALAARRPSPKSPECVASRARRMDEGHKTGCIEWLCFDCLRELAYGRLLDALCVRVAPQRPSFRE